MGRFKEQNREGIKEMQKGAAEAGEIGSVMIEQATEINAVLESIDLQDSEDVAAVQETKKGYQPAFDSAFTDQVESMGEQIEQQGEQIGGELSSELENVRGGIGKLEQAGGISEIGRDVAEAGASRLEESVGEYEGLISEAQETVQEMQAQISSMKGELGSAFGG